MSPYLFLLLSSTFITASSVTAINRPKPEALSEVSHSNQVVLTSNGHLSKVKGPHHDKPFKQLVNGSTPTGWIQLGTPKKWLLVIFDTGSDKLVAKTWETVAAELDSVDQGVQGMVMPSKNIYNHETSSSYQRKYMKGPDGKDVPKQSQITYGSGTAITDDGSETVTVGNRGLENFTVMEITADSLQLLHTSTGIAGVLGLQHMKNKSLGNSLFSRMRDNDLMTSFGYCRGSSDNGTFIWGDDSTEGHSMDVVGEMHWAVKLGELSVDKAGDKDKKGSSLAAKRSKSPDADFGDAADSSGSDDSSMNMDDPSMDSEEDPSEAEALLKDTCPKEGCIGILDTGSNIIAGPSDVMKSITSLVDVKPDCSNFDSLPPIKFTFGGLPVTVHASGYVMKVPMPAGGFGGDGAGGGAYSDGESPAGDGEGAAGDGDGTGSLSEEQSSSSRAATNRKWKAVFERLNRNYGIDLRSQINDLLQASNSTTPEFLCMPALVPLDKHTKYGPLYVVGTPLLDSYYARWSFAKKDKAPKIHLEPLKDAKVCKDELEDAFSGDSTKSLMRRQALDKVDIKVTTRMPNRGPIERLPEEIAYPHWAKDLLHV